MTCVRIELFSPLSMAVVEKKDKGCDLNWRQKCLQYSTEKSRLRVIKSSLDRTSFFRRKSGSENPNDYE